MYAFIGVALVAGIVWASQSQSGTVAVSSASVLAEMRVSFGTDVTAAEVKGSPQAVRIDVYTDYFPDSDVAQIASGMARIAAQSSSVVSKYPTTRIDAYVWPKAKDFYMTRTSASYTDGKLDAPMDNYLNAALQ
jgi:hypothetical protein